MNLVILVFVIIAILCAVASGVWVAIALVKSIASSRTLNNRRQRLQQKDQDK